MRVSALPLFVVACSATPRTTTFVFDGLPGKTATIEIRGSSTINADLVGPDGFIEAAGQTVTIRASSINIDAALLIDFIGGSAFDNNSDSGGGVIGFDAMMVYTAPETGSYAVAVFDETGFGPGGYILTVEETER